jgi:hypothetical protein
VLFGEQAREMGLPLPMAMPRGTVTELPAAIRLTEPFEGNALGATVEMLSGKAAGHAMYLTGTRGDIVIVGMGEAHFEELAAIAPGDEVSIDNSVYLAFQTMHRHQVDPDFEPWQQFTEGGRPIYPQRPRKIGPVMARQGSGVSQSGRFAGKMIVVQTLMDEAAYPWQALWYRKKVRAQLGDRIDDQYRLWFVEHAMHTGGAEPVAGLGTPDLVPSRRTRMVSYLGVLQQALRDVAAWVELGIAPPASTTCTYVDGQVHVPATRRSAAGRRPSSGPPPMVPSALRSRPASPSGSRRTSRCRTGRAESSASSGTSRTGATTPWSRTASMPPWPGTRPSSPTSSPSPVRTSRPSGSPTSGPSTSGPPTAAS